MKSSKWLVGALVCVIGLLGAGNASAAIYTQNFDTLSEATSGTVADVNTQLSTISWQLYSVVPWNSGKKAYVTDTGSGDMAVQLMPRNTSTYSGTPIRDLALYRPAVAPDYLDIVATGKVTWGASLGVNRASYYGPGMVLRADSSAGASAGGAFSGTFYLVRLLDADSAYYGASGDTMDLIQVVNGVETVVSGVSVAWQNGFANFNTQASRADAYLKVTIQNTAENYVSINAVYSTDSTFSDASQEIISGSWLDQSAGRILTGGTVGFGDASNGSFYSSSSLYWDDLSVDTISLAVPEPATLALLAIGGLALAGSAVRRRNVERLAVAR